MEDKINIGLIIKGCLDGNNNSQKVLYQHFYGFGMNVALRYASNYSDAEEILNDSFLRVFNNLDKYDSSYPFKPWLRKIIINQAIDAFHKNKKRLKTTFIEHTEIPPYSHHLDIDDEEDVLPILQELTPMYRMVFNLYVMEEYKHHQIAEKLGISVGTSKSNLARAKAKLRELWLKKRPTVKTNDNG